MSGIEGAASVLTLFDVIVRIANLAAQIKDAPKELRDLIKELETLNKLHGAIQQVTTNLEGLENLTVFDNGKGKDILTYSHEQLAKVIKNASETILKKYGQSDASWWRKWFGIVRFGKEKEFVKGLIDSVEHAKSALQLAFEAALLCRDDLRIQQIQASIKEMKCDSLSHQQNIEGGISRSLGEHAKRTNAYFSELRQSLHQSLERHKSQMGEQSKEIMISCANNNVLMERLVKPILVEPASPSSAKPKSSTIKRVARWLKKPNENPKLLQNAKSVSDSNADLSHLEHSSHTTKLQSQSSVSNDRNNEQEIGDDSDAAIQEQFDHGCTQLDEAIDSKPSIEENGSNSTSLEDPHEQEVTREEFENIVAESFFDLSDANKSQMTEDSASEVGSSESSGSTSSSPSGASAWHYANEIVPAICIDDNVKLRDCEVEKKKQLRFCVDQLYVNMDFYGCGRSESSEEEPEKVHADFVLIQPCLNLSSCQHITMQLSKDEFHDLKSGGRETVTVYPRTETILNNCLKHTSYVLEADNRTIRRCIYQDMCLYGHRPRRAPSPISSTSSKLQDLEDLPIRSNASDVSYMTEC